MTDTFEAFVAQQRERLMKKRADVLEARAEVDRQLAEIDREMAAIQAYEDVKHGKPVRGSTDTRTRRGSKRDTLLALIRNAPEGITRADILTQMDVKGDRKAEQSISNALTALKKAGAIDSADGKYVAIGG